MLVDSFQNEILSSQTFTLLISLLVTVLRQRGSRGVQGWEDNDSSWSPNNLRKLFTYIVGETKFYVSFTLMRLLTLPSSRKCINLTHHNWLFHLLLFLTREYAFICVKRRTIACNTFTNGNKQLFARKSDSITSFAF